MSALPFPLRICFSTAAFEDVLIVRHSEKVSDTDARHITMTAVRRGLTVILRNIILKRNRISPHPYPFLRRHVHTVFFCYTVYFIESVNAGQNSIDTYFCRAVYIFGNFLRSVGVK